MKSFSLLGREGPVVFRVVLSYMRRMFLHVTYIANSLRVRPARGCDEGGAYFAIHTRVEMKSLDKVRIQSHTCTMVWLANGGVHNLVVIFVLGFTSRVVCADSQTLSQIVLTKVLGHQRWCPLRFACCVSLGCRGFLGFSILLRLPGPGCVFLHSASSFSWGSWLLCA